MTALSFATEATGRAYSAPPNHLAAFEEMLCSRTGIEIEAGKNQ